MTMIVHLGAAAPMSLGMVWQTAWSLILGFTISAPLQTIVSTGEMRAAFGRGAKEIALAAAAGAASSSCSYWRMAAYLLVMPFATTAIAGAMVNAAVALLGLVPAPAHVARSR